MKNELTDSEQLIINALVETQASTDWPTASAIESCSRKKGGALNAPTIYRTLSRTKLRKVVEYRTRDGTRRFHLKHSGHAIVGKSSVLPHFVRPGTAWSTQRELRVFLGTLNRGPILIIDPYISEETLDVLSDVNVPIQVLAAHIGRKDKQVDFLRAYKKFRTEKKGNVEIRQCSESELHGRYIMSPLQGWVVDHSLQDLGTKPALIIPLHLGPTFNAVRQHFDAIFRVAVAI